MKKGSNHPSFLYPALPWPPVVDLVHAIEIRSRIATQGEICAKVYAQFVLSPSFCF